MRRCPFLGGLTGFTIHIRRRVGQQVFDPTRCETKFVLRTPKGLVPRPTVRSAITHKGGIAGLHSWRRPTFFSNNNIFNINNNIVVMR